jgi:two-component system chemotaxis response regulator CheY
MKTILIVDDSATMRRMIKASLQKFENVCFEEAENGLEAIERLTIGSIDLMIL